MTTGLEVGDKRQVINTLSNNYDIGDIIEYTGHDGVYYGFERLYDRMYQVLHWHQFEKLEEDTTMATKKTSNPKNFRNGDVVKVSDRKGNDAMVFVKFGENYYNLSAGGQMKACRYLPPGTKEIVTNLSGMGKFFLMSEEELEEQAGRPSGVFATGTDGVSSRTPVTDFEHIMKLADSYIQNENTEEKW